MTTVKVKFRPSTIADRPGSIIYLVTHRRLVRQITTDYKIYPHEWDKQQSKLIVSHESRRLSILQSIAQRLGRDMALLEKIIEMFEFRQPNYTADDIVAVFHRESCEKSLFNYMERVIHRMRQLNHTGTAHNYQAALNSIRRFRDDRDIAFDEITHILVEDYQAYLKSTELAPNSISFLYANISRSLQSNSRAGANTRPQTFSHGIYRQGKDTQTSDFNLRPKTYKRT